MLFMRRTLLTLSLVTLPCLVGACAQTVDAGAGPGNARALVLAELFTSEGCSSCPPADRLMAQLVADQPLRDAFVVLLSEHVDYWDHLGWKDPFSSPRATERQQAYGRWFGLDSIYTPQLVVDGQAQVVGSDEGAVRAALSAAARRPKAALQVVVNDVADRATAVVSGGTLDAKDRGPIDIFVALAEDDLSVDVRAGETARRHLRHAAVMRWLVLAGTSTGQAPTVTVSAPVRIDPSFQRERLHVIAFAQARRSGRVVALGWCPVPPLATSR
jgi:hypothetical protein